MTKLVRLYPTHLAYIGGVPAIEQEVSAERAEELLAYTNPPVFTTNPPATEPTIEAPASEPPEE